MYSVVLVKRYTHLYILPCWSKGIPVYIAVLVQGYTCVYCRAGPGVYLCILPCWSEVKRYTYLCILSSWSEGVPTCVYCRNFCLRNCRAFQKVYLCIVSCWSKGIPTSVCILPRCSEGIPVYIAALFRGDTPLNSAALGV